MIHLIKKLLGSNNGSAEKIEAKTQEAHDIRNQMTSDSLRSKERVDIINLNTYHKLQKISDDLADVTYTIAIATGAKRRGFKG